MMSKEGPVRCCVYTRKSTDENLDSDFNSLAAQRDAAENYIKSQAAKGWICLPEHYDDPAYSGANINRPGLQKLIEDVEAGKIDVVLTYKVDRLSRSLVDFANLMMIFEKHHVSYVSITQNIDTSTSAGKMMMNLLVAFGQFERELVAERIKDKMSASRKRGMWVGGTVPMGYRAVDKKLIVDESEAKTIRWIFREYLNTRSPKLLCMKLNEKGIRRRDGGEWIASHIYRILENYTYSGRVKYKGEVYPGEHEAIIDLATWEQVQAALHEKSDPMKNLGQKNQQDTVVVLKDLVRCGNCGAAMSGVSSRKKNRTYQYYQCQADRKRAIKRCSDLKISADVLDTLVVKQVQRILTTPSVQARLVCDDLDLETVKRYTEGFAEVWPQVFPVERYRLIHLLIQQIVVYPDHADVEFRTSGLTDLIKELSCAAD